ILDWLVQVVGGARVARLRLLLTLVAGTPEIVVEYPRDELLTPDCRHGHAAHGQLPAVMRGRPDDRFRRYLWLVDRRYRLCLMWQAAAHPAELRCIQRRHVDHRDPDLAVLLDQFAAQRVSETDDRVFRTTIRR